METVRQRKPTGSREDVIAEEPTTSTGDCRSQGPGGFLLERFCGSCLDVNSLLGSGLRNSSTDQGSDGAAYLGVTVIALLLGLTVLFIGLLARHQGRLILMPKASDVTLTWHVQTSCRLYGNGTESLCMLQVLSGLQ